MASMLYPAFKRSLGEGVFDLAADTLRCALLTSAHAPSADHARYADVAADEVAGAGYVAGGQALSGVAWSLSGTTVVLDADDAHWSDVTVTARYAVLYADKTTTGGQVDPLVCLLDFGTDKGVVDGIFTVAFDAAGILALD
jgi:hypothetical protein